MCRMNFFFIPEPNLKNMFQMLKEEVLYYIWWIPLNFIKEIPFQIKWWWQRRVRGWDDRDIWSLDITIAKFVLPRLKYLREHHCGYPCDLQEIEWDMILDEVIESFELIIECDGFMFDKEEMGIKQAKIERGLLLFAKHFQGLWD